MFIAYPRDNDSAILCLIARGLEEIYFLKKIFKKWNKTLEFGCIFLFEMFISYMKIMLISKTAFAMGLWGIIIFHGEIFEKITQYGEFGFDFLYKQLNMLIYCNRGRSLDRSVRILNV